VLTVLLFVVPGGIFLCYVRLPLSNHGTPLQRRADTFLLKFNQPNEALSLYEELLKDEPDNVDNWFRRGLCLEAMRRDAEAIKSYRKALSFDPSRDEVQERMLSLLNRRGLHHQLAKEIEDLLHQDPLNETALSWKTAADREIWKDDDDQEAGGVVDPVFSEMTRQPPRRID